MAKVAAGLLLASAAVALVFAQDHTTFRTGATFIRVDVFPTSKGAPVSDLKQDEFEVFEDKVPQKIATFEHVVVRGYQSDDLKREPITSADALQQMQSARGRVLVLFLDPYHVESDMSAHIRRPLTAVLDRALGPDDLIAVMRPEMRPNELAFTPKHSTVDGVLSTFWGQRDSLFVDDPLEDTYRACYPPTPTNGTLAEDMIDRRRESRTIAALRDLVAYLGPARDERKAVLVVTDGWKLFEPDPNMARPLDDVAPPMPPIQDPRGRGPSRALTVLPLDIVSCERDRFALAQIDDVREMQEIEQDANRGNISFYPIDPRGLAAYDENPSANPRIDPATGVFAPPAPAASPRKDRAALTARVQSLRALAESTDGLALVESNNIAGSLKKMIDDLSSYYLIGYNSTGKLDGKFHAIAVRIKRPGVDVRARRGFLAANTIAVTPSSLAAAPSLSGPGAAEAAALSSAVGSLSAFERDQPIRIRLAAASRDGATAIWAAGELSGDEWKAGAEVDLLVLDGNRQTRASAHASVPVGARGFKVAIASPELAPGAYSVVARARGVSGATITDSAALTIAAPPTDSGVLLFRRGPSTGNRDTPVVDARFRRVEQLRVDTPAGGVPIRARLLDRSGRELPVPLTITARQDPDGARWQAVQLSLAPFAPGDYVIELTKGPDADLRRTLLPFRIIP
jgi:VWFA-related protein